MNGQGGFLVSRIKQIHNRIFERILAKQDIDAFNGAQGRILYVLWQADGVPMNVISRETGLATTTLTSMIDRMEATDLIYRKRDANDRRKVLIYISDKAKELKGSFDAVGSEMCEIFYQGFSEQEVIELDTYLQRVLANLENCAQELQ